MRAATSSAQEGTARLSWRQSPDLLINDESLVEVITKLRVQVQAIEKNELLSGNALPSWLLKAFTEVANNADTAVECHALQDQVAFLQKEVLDMQHELLLQQSANNSMQSFNPTPTHRSSMKSIRKKTISAANENVVASAKAVAAEIMAQQVSGASPTVTDGVSMDMVETMLKPIWEFIHKQTNDAKTLRASFQEAKDTVNRLQSEIKRRDALVQARNEKHENDVQNQVDKLNESLRACVARNDLISAEQRIAQQMKNDRARMLEDVESRTNKLLEDLLASRADQEDINSMNAETIQVMIRKQGRLEEIVVDLTKDQQEAKERETEMTLMLKGTMTKLDQTELSTATLQEKAKSFEETQAAVQTLSKTVQEAADNTGVMKGELQVHMAEKIAESVAIVRGELEQVNSTVMEIVNQNLDSELKALAGKMDIMGLSVTDCVRKIALILKQSASTEDQNRSQFTQLFDSLDRMLHSISNLSEESMRLSYNLQHVMEAGDKLSQEVHDYRELTDQSIVGLRTTAQDMQAETDKTNKIVSNELSLVKNQLFHIEDVNSTMRRDIEATQREVDRNFRDQHEENARTHGALNELNIAREEIMSRQDSAESQMMALQAENRADIQASTNKLVAIVDKESDRVEALYRSFQQKQEQFAEVVARSSIRNMDLTDMNREMDRICEVIISECWKFEISARSSNKTSARLADSSNNNAVNGGAARKLFNERQQQLLVRNCQFFADLIVGRAEHEVLLAGSNKDVKNQHNLEELMIDAQAVIVDKMKTKINTKIMNNKNIGEQFDKSTLDRRELYIETISNMLDASMKRRTMGDFDRPARDSFGGDTGSSRTSFLETQRLMTANGNGGTSRRISTRGGSGDNRHPSIALMASGLGGDMERTAFSPGSSYVFRAGFRLPKTSPPNSPGMTMRKGLTSGGMTGSTLDLVSEVESPVFLTAPPPEASELSKDNASSSSTLRGWSTEDSIELDNGMTKSYSLPVLKQQQ